MVSIDLKDAYLSVPIFQDHRKFLRFIWKDMTYQFQCLPFGLSSAPRVSKKLLKPVMALLRKRGIRSLIFLDKMLLMAHSKQELEQQLQEVLTFFRWLGFRINWAKLQLTPTQFYHIDLIEMNLTLPKEKIKRIISESQTATWKGMVYT